MQKALSGPIVRAEEVNIFIIKQPKSASFIALICREKLSACRRPCYRSLQITTADSEGKRMTVGQSDDLKAGSPVTKAR